MRNVRSTPWSETPLWTFPIIMYKYSGMGSGVGKDLTITAGVMLATDVICHPARIINQDIFEFEVILLCVNQPAVDHRV
jgi:hypothetical protein